MTTDEQVYTGLPATDDAERERMLNLVHALHEARSDESKARNANRAISELLRAYLEEHPGDLWDGERGEGVALKVEGGRRWLDPSAVTPEQLQALAGEGCLELSARQWDALVERSATVPDLLDLVTAVKPHVHQGSVTKLVLLREETR
jgi:hypothetical protein